MLKFLSHDIWKDITRLAKKSKKSKVAVAYFGKGAAEQLPLKKGDTLIVAMTLNNVSCGQVNPYEIEKLFDKDVKIYTVANLHAKVYLFDKTAVVGSPNVSSNSTFLVESGLLTDDTKIVKEIEQFISNKAIERVERDYIELCKENYKPPKFSGTKAKQVSAKKIKPKFSNLWIVSTRFVYFTEDDEQAIDKNKKNFEKEIINTRAFALKEIKYPINDRFINNVKKGDLIIELSKQKVRVQVLKPQRVLGVTFEKRLNTAYLWAEDRRKPIAKSWTDLEKFLRNKGVRSIRKNSTRLIRNDDVKEALLQFFK